MNRELETRLVTFCVAQHAGFDPTAWTSGAGFPPQALSTVARFLAGVRWYGHTQELDAIAARLDGGGAAHATRYPSFQPSRFSGLLRAHLRHADSVAA